MKDAAFLFALLLILLGGVGAIVLVVQEFARALKQELTREVIKTLDRHLETWPLALVRRPDQLIPVTVSSNARQDSFTLLLPKTKWARQRLFLDEAIKPGSTGVLALYIS